MPPACQRHQGARLAWSARVPRRDALLLSCMFGSGAAALTYEVIWLRQLSLAMGHTAQTLAVVLVCLMGGLALGAWLGGRLVARRGSSLRLYAAIELGIAGSALAVPLLLWAASPIVGAAFRAWSDGPAFLLVELGLAAAILVAPASLMGATLPVAEALLELRGRGAGPLYAANCLGGALGAPLAAFILLPRAGMSGTVACAAALNVAACVLALAARRARPESAPARPALPPSPGLGWPSPGRRACLMLYFLAGAAALALEVGWSRAVALAIGSSIQGYAIILATYVLGLGLGASLLPRLEALRRDQVRAVFLLHALIASSSLATLPLLGKLPVAVVWLSGADTAAGVLVGQAWLVGATILLPTLAMGALFPLTVQMLGRPAGRSVVGDAYAANTAGCIVGSLAAGFLLAHWYAPATRAA